MYGGDIACQSELGVGTTITFALLMKSTCIEEEEDESFRVTSSESSSRDEVRFYEESPSNSDIVESSRSFASLLLPQAIDARFDVFSTDFPQDPAVYASEKSTHQFPVL